MTPFWLLAASMASLALVFIALPLLRNRNRVDIDRDQLNIALIREQLTELKADMDAGKLGAEDYEASRHDLERELLDAVDEDGQKSQKPSRSGRWVLAVLLPAVPILAVMIYLQLGAGDLSDKATQALASQTGNPGDMSEHDLNRMLEQLAQRLREEPDHPEGWILLGRSYTSMRRYSDAIAAYEQARKYGGDSPELLIDYADTLIAANRGDFNDQAGAMLQQALAQQPDNLKGLWLIGHWYFQRGNYQSAQESWQRVAAQVQPGSENARVLQQQIQLARTKLGDAVPRETTPATDNSTDKAAFIRVTVSLDPALQDSAAPDDTLFIFARAINGPRMPLAIVRKQVRDLPVTVTLNDSMAMSPAAVLSRFPQVSIGARISKTGQAMPASGDLQGMQSPVSTTDKSATVNIVINERVGL